ncbi:hypothetical protein GOODEAATRI_014580 [Goodea atripinnis]|uniref:Secreted protein n=1 Tax=Goodea atripinnis TaxID=208336 RepID=A0ABV0NLX5_9TELE
MVSLGISGGSLASVGAGLMWALAGQEGKCWCLGNSSLTYATPHSSRVLGCGTMGLKGIGETPSSHNPNVRHTPFHSSQHSTLPDTHRARGAWHGPLAPTTEPMSV